MVVEVRFDREDDNLIVATMIEKKLESLDIKTDLRNELINLMN